MMQDMSQQPPWQELVASDLHGNEWHFRHIFRGYDNFHLWTLILALALAWPMCPTTK